MTFLKKILAYGEETCDFCGGTDWSEVTPGSGTWFSLDKKRWEHSDFFEEKFEEGKLKKGDTLFKYEARQEPKVKKKKIT